MSLRLAAVAATACLTLCTCSQKPRPAWPNAKPDVDNVKLRPEVVSVDRALANRAVVTRDSLKFPASMAAQVMQEWPAGKVLLGQPAEDLADKKTNPFGFMRKVKGTAVIGDEVVVETEPALLEEVVQGQFHRTIDLDSAQPVVLPPDTDLSAFDVALDDDGPLPKFPVIRGEDAGVQAQPLTDPTAKGELMLFGKRVQALTASGPAFDVPPTEVPIFNEQFEVVAADRPNARLNFDARLSVTPTFDVRPSLVLDYDWNELKFRMESFEFQVGAEGRVGLTADAFVGALPSAQLSASDRQTVFNHLSVNPKRIPLKKRPIGKPVLRFFELGPIPIVLKAEAFLKCTMAIKGPTRVRGTVAAQFAPKVGVEYTHADGWNPTMEFPRPTLTVSGETPDNRANVEVECGVVGRVDLLAGGVAGPWAQVRRALVLNGVRAEVCDPARPTDHQATQRTSLELRMYDDFQVGFAIRLLRKDFGAGPYDVYRRDYDEVSGPPYTPNRQHVDGAWWTGPAEFPTVTWTPIWSWRRDVADAGLTRCEVACDDQQKSPGEADVDCGGPTCFKCRKGKTCASGADCASGVCTPAMTCMGAPCDDDVKGQQESDVDCGGPTCAKCAAGKTCTAGSDCGSGVCGDNGRCVQSKCEDGVRGQEETDVDCGGATCGPCALTKACAADRDCGEGFCSRDGVSARTCTDNLCRDGQRSGTEPDVDCGVSEGCSRLCAVGQRCNSDGDCGSGACNLSSGLCVASACEDARQDRGETDVDCGGPCQTKCALTRGCDWAANGNADCQSGVCSSAGACVATACENRRKDQGEVGVDCSGACAARCPLHETCGASADCLANLVCHPLRRRCELPGCDDGFKNGQESAVDCGGPVCSKCAIAKACNAGSDCVTGLCDRGRCISTVCENGVKDATEADVDCGGTACAALKCGLGKTCAAGSDCASNICVGGVCISDPCRDRVRNGAETDVDCGGGTCAARCATQQTCNVGTDCASGQCNGTTRRCVGTGCEDGQRGGTETDVDCGGSCATKCAVNKTCATGADCASGVCNATTLRCVPDQCFDGVRNGSETDVDCGGACDARCGFDRLCSSGVDCQSGGCGGTGRCAADQCSDGRLNGNETAVDCGGQCATRCAVGQGCLSGADCAHPQMLVGVPGYCAVTTRTCTTSSCTTGQKDGDETDVDCGGSCSAKCAVGKACTGNVDCASGICHATRRTCAASQLDDGIKNGSETDIDCGGGVAAGCPVGLACLDPMDCASGYCSESGLCLPPYPQSCAGLPTGLATIDPDGPRRLGLSGAGYALGGLRPFTTYCESGWTPVFFQSSQGDQVMQSYDPNAVFFNAGSYNPRGNTCTVDADCIALDPASRCREATRRGPCTDSQCLCATDAVWSDTLMPPGLTTAPANLSVSQASERNYQQFNYPLPATGARYTANPVIGWSSTGGTPGGPQTFRWTAYRNGVLVFDSGLFTAYDLRSNADEGYDAVSGGAYISLRRGNSASALGIADTSTLGWCQTGTLRDTRSLPQPNSWWHNSQAQYFNTTPPYPDSDVASGPTPTNNRCYDVGQTPVGGQYVAGARQNLSTAYAISLVTYARPDSVPSAGDSAKGYVGLWTGYYGLTSGGCTSGPCNSPSAAPRINYYMGVCNGMSSSTTRGLSCMGIHHFNGEPFQWQTSRGELDPSASDVGTVMEHGVPGLVFVLWAQ